MKDEKVRKLVFAALMTAVTTVATAVLYIPLPYGFANLGDAAVLLSGGLISFGLSWADWGVILAGVAVIFAVSLWKKELPLRETVAKRPVLFCACLSVLSVVILLFGAYGIGYDASQFIYNQF